jgi:hypothetical protein
VEQFFKFFQRIFTAFRVTQKQQQLQLRHSQVFAAHRIVRSFFKHVVYLLDVRSAMVFPVQ